MQHPAPLTPQTLLQRFEKQAPEGSKERIALLDVFHMLRAQQLAGRGNLEEAAKAWLAAARVATGPFGEKAFAGWIGAYCASLPERPAHADIVARLIAAETGEGNTVPYMRDNGINSAERYLDSIRKYATGCVDGIGLSEESLPTLGKGVPADDPALNRRAQLWCKASDRMEKVERAVAVGEDHLDVSAVSAPESSHARVDNARSVWANWEESLPPLAREYWQLRTKECHGENFEPIVAGYRQLAPQLLDSGIFVGMGLEATNRIVQIFRAQGLREAAARAYIDLAKAWSTSGLTHVSLGMSPKEFRLRRIDDLLWASRYAAMIADYESSKRLAQDSLTLTASFPRELNSITAADREKVASFRAEAYHVLGFRVALETHDLEGALSSTLVGLAVPGISTEWRERLNWYAGLYEFILGRYDDARRRWEQLLAELKDQSQKPKLYFWLARAHRALEQEAESEFYVKAIVDDYPLSFYAVVATDLARLKSSKRWRDVFKPDMDIRASFVQIDMKQLAPLRKKLPVQLMRAEVLTRARVTDYARIAIRELESQSEKVIGKDQSTAVKQYIARMYFVSGSYTRAIRRTSDLSSEQDRFWQKYPEHVLAFFPQPFADYFDTAAEQRGLDPSVLLGITRQESIFDATVKSPAQAVGLMQLLPITAQKHSPDLKDSSLAAIEESLLQPKNNITAGANYLKFLDKYYHSQEPQIFAAYNAGEFAVDGWVSRRPNPDQLTWIEFIPFGETQGYVKNVWRNVVVYRYLKERLGGVANSGATEISAIGNLDQSLSALPD